MDIISTTEDALIAKTIATVVDGDGKSLLKKVDHLPGELNLKMLRQLTAHAPGVYWSFLGGRVKDNEHDVQLNSSWMMYVITSHASGNDARRRGDARQIGAYEIMAPLIPVMNNFIVPNAGALRFRQARNLYSGELEKNSVALYAASFELLMNLSIEEDNTLDDFITFHADYDIPSHETLTEHNKWLLEPADYSSSKPDAQDDVTLEQ